MNHNIKQAKLHTKHRPCHGSITGLRKIPQLSLSGDWLQEAGFTLGRQIEIRVSQEQLMIKAI